MPVSYRIDRARGFIETTCSGEIHLEHVLAHFEELEALPSLPARLDVLLDVDQVKTLPQSADLERVAKAVGSSRVEWGACAIVAGRDALYGMLRVFEVFAREQFAATRVCRDRGEAERWLDSIRRQSG